MCNKSFLGIVIVVGVTIGTIGCATTHHERKCHLAYEYENGVFHLTIVENGHVAERHSADTDFIALLEASSAGKRWVIFLNPNDSPERVPAQIEVDQQTLDFLSKKFTVVDTKTLTVQR